MKIENLSNKAIAVALLDDPYYEGVAWEFLDEAIETARAESKAKTVAGLNAYIKENLI